MLTRNEIERLATAVHGLRPDWPVTSLVQFIAKRDIRPLLDLTVELAWVAQLPDTKTPARIDEDGPWKSAVRTAAPANTSDLLPTSRHDDCRECGRPATHASHFDDSDLGCKYVSPTAWAQRAQTADHHAKAAEVRAALSNTEETA